MEDNKKQGFNPYLPSYEYIPDAEPRVFGDRVYIYGSHDKFNSRIFCVGDYICYSAPVDDLTDWRYEGVIFTRKSDPCNKSGFRLLFAPDVVQGKDGKYYLYYAFDFLGIMGVAVCDTPAGEYKFLGHIQYADGKKFGRRKGDQFPFDPGVLVDDDGKIYLYSGFAIDIPAIASGFTKLKTDGGVVMELEDDMFTLKTEPKLIFPKKGEGSIPNHEFFEASSIRKINGKYYFVYSSGHNHELCYMVSDYPDRDYEYKGTLVSIGDLFLEGEDHKLPSQAKNYLGNTHGGMLELNGKYYIFYHRQTNRHSYSRQACAEELIVDENGNLKQAELTSMGFNGKPLIGKGTYEARIACQLYTTSGALRYDDKKVKKHFKNHPFFTQEGKDREDNPDQYIANFVDGSIAGFKYFDMDNVLKISVALRGKASGQIEVFADNELSECVATISVDINSKKCYTNFEAECTVPLVGKKPLHFKFSGKGAVDFKEFTLD